jgi:hypothetical protein
MISLHGAEGIAASESDLTAMHNQQSKPATDGQVLLGFASLSNSKQAL